MTKLENFSYMRYQTNDQHYSCSDKRSQCRYGVAIKVL